ncbi:MAG: exodeoxyribonuclease VII large subunit [Clostridiales bacterium]|nr:exodeoxyribonuclease VII large subunit [Clostridiales bacterium]
MVSVSAVNNYIKLLIDSDMTLEDIWIQGEISNFKHHYTGHMYFTLKDEKSRIKCVMFKGQNVRLDFVPEDGEKVMIRATVSVFERDGQYQCYVKDILKYGKGNLHLELEKLKNKLKDKGYFDKSIKKDIPYLPQSIVVLTSKTGAVIRDILNVLGRRYSNFRLKLLPIPVQGPAAAPLIAKAIDFANEKKLGDVIILARGGGSIEELWPFNEEIVADSIYKSNIPIISAIGHETDYTIADFVADKRAPTPSAAAEIVMPEKLQLLDKINELGTRIRNALLNEVSRKRDKLDMLKSRSVLKKPFERIYQDRLRLDVFNKYMKRAIDACVAGKKNELRTIICSLDALSPLKVLERGYGVIIDKASKNIVSSVRDVEVGKDILLKLKDGEVSCVVDKVTKEGMDSNGEV